MKIIGLGGEIWSGNSVSLAVSVEADRPEARFVCGQYASHILHIAFRPQLADGSAIDTEWCKGLIEGEHSLDQWLKPLPDEPGAYEVQQGVMMQFPDAFTPGSLRTSNGYPIIHAFGPANLREEGIANEPAAPVEVS